VTRTTVPAVVALLFVGFAAHDRASAQPAGKPLAFGEARSFHSAILNEDRELQISLPDSYGRTAVAYPVLFLLDGSSHVLHATATTRFLASARSRIPEMIVVALPNTNRNRDMTPGPGAATFQRVLAEEIIPWVERSFRAAPERILFGHSLTASFAVHTLLNRPELFRAYVAASAPIWRYEGFSADVRAGLPRAAKAGAAIYLTVGQHENEQLRNGVQQFAATLKSAPAGSAPAWSFVDMKDEDHSSTPQRSLYDALEARYADWRLPFFEDEAGLAKVGGWQGIDAHYQRFSKHFGYAAPPPEGALLSAGSINVGAERHDEVLRMAKTYAVPYPALSERLVNQVGYDQLKRGQTDRAVKTFKDNADAFPDSPNVHDSLGDAYCRAGDEASARQSYARAARVAETRSPPHPRAAWYRDKANKGCALTGVTRAIALVTAIGGATLYGSTAGPQVVDRSQPPRIDASTGGFAVRRLAAPVEVDGRSWIEVTPIVGAGTVRAPDGQFAIALEEAGSGDVVYFRVSIIEGGGAPVQVLPGTGTYAFITPDSRWIIAGTLEAVDVRNWRRYSLSRAFDIGAYVIPRAISADGRRLFIVKRACPFDCRDIPDEYYEVEFPRR
jgi:predicted alpha/beta superfamily hydrolase